MFGMGFTEIMIIAVIAILFLGPDKLPEAMVDIAKFFRSAKNTIGSMKDTLEEEMHVKGIKEEALAYKKELLSTSEKIKNSTNIKHIGAKLTSLDDDIFNENEIFLDEKEEKVPKSKVKKENSKNV
ncbi:MAG: Sec-independent protein translocase protein TatB [Sulfurimonas sp.]|nr:Sec-independent protein translocase protein TatB [Sulfurimonas sp.]